MKFRSLTDSSIQVDFAQAIADGIAPDGGLYYPVEIPKFSSEQIHSLRSASQQEAAFLLLSACLSDEIPEDALLTIIDQAASFPTPIKTVGDKKVLELFHGPTLAFKDVGARYLAAFMGYFNARNDQKTTVLVATSGDTGGGIAQAFSGVVNTQVVVLFPKGRVSALQYEQLTRAGDNIISLEIEGSFDDCQDLVKKAFSDGDLNDLHLTSANSINVGRLLPQMTYYSASYAELQRDDVRMVIPTGNLGNLTAGLLAREMGLPLNRFVAANNSNDAVHRYLETGEYQPNVSRSTMSNAMDVGAPNNVPRVQELFHHDIDAIRQVVQSTVVNDEETVATIQSVHKQHSYLLDPHTAVAWAASDRLADNTCVDVVVATASPLKFAEEIEKATGITVDNSSELQLLRKRDSKLTQIDAHYKTFKEYVLGTL